MDTVAAQEEPVVGLRRFLGVVDTHRFRGAHRAREGVRRSRMAGRVVHGEASELAASQPVQPRVADMQHMQPAPAQHGRGQGAGHTLERGVRAPDRVQPAVQRLDGAPGRATDAERLALAEQPVEQHPHRELGCHASALGAADAVRDGGHHALQGASARFAEPERGVVLVARARAALAAEAGTDFEPALSPRLDRRQGRRRTGGRWRHVVQDAQSPVSSWRGVVQRLAAVASKRRFDEGGAARRGCRSPRIDYQRRISSPAAGKNRQAVRVLGTRPAMERRTGTRKHSHHGGKGAPRGGCVGPQPGAETARRATGRWEW